MDTQIILVYCLCDDLLKAMQHQEDIQCQMSDAEVMTVALVAALNHGGNFVKASAMLSEQGYMPVMLSKSRFSRRLHRIKPMFLSLFAHLGEHFKAMNEESVYLIDTFPLTQWGVAHKQPVTTIALLVRNGTEVKPIAATKPARNVTSMASKCIYWPHPTLNLAQRAPGFS
jgi:hypothetical protein